VLELPSFNFLFFVRDKIEDKDLDKQAQEFAGKF
jgi:hypothetical protein